MRSKAEIELQIRQMEKVQQRRLQVLAANDPTYQKAQGALEAFRAMCTEAAESDEDTDVIAHES